MSITDIFKIGSVTPVQARNKFRKPALRRNTRFSKNKIHPTPSNNKTTSTMSKNITVTLAVERLPKKAVRALNSPDYIFTSFLYGVTPELTNNI